MNAVVNGSNLGYSSPSVEANRFQITLKAMRTQVSFLKSTNQLQSIILLHFISSPKYI